MAGVQVVGESACVAEAVEAIRALQPGLDAHESPWLQRLVVRSGERFDFVPVDSVDWIESANNDTVLHGRSKDLVFSEI